jgi:hypothetical protein
MNLKVRLTRDGISRALTKLPPSLAKYLRLQSAIAAGPTACKQREFQKAYNGFYRVRRSPEWQSAYYDVMSTALRARRRSPVGFHHILVSLYKRTGRVEASFASKLVATIDPSQPVIDAVIMANVGARLPYFKNPNRLSLVADLHTSLADCYAEYLRSPGGRYLISQFKKRFPKAKVTAVKMLDLVLWQDRSSKRGTRRK